MEAGIPLAILTLLSVPIVLIWAKFGVGKKSTRCIVATVIIGILCTSWVLVLNFGSFSNIGQLGVAVGCLVGICALFVPQIHRRWTKTEID